MNTFLNLFVLGALCFGSDGEDDGRSAYEHPFELEAHREIQLDTSGGALIRNVTIHDANQPAYVGDVLVAGGKIQKIGSGLTAPRGAVVIDGTGKHLAPGVVDTHSHMAIERGINEGTVSITADCDITDVINVDDLGIYRALAGGVTTIQCLHGSANTIGGRSEVLKLKWGQPTDELRFPDAPQGIKFALGENVKRSNWGDQTRYPASRPGVEGVFHRGFRRAQEYAAEWEVYRSALQRGEDPVPPRRDVRLDVLVGVLEGEVLVHSHCYRADEILMLMRIAETFGFRIGTLQHVLEGYKVAQEIADHGAGPSTFSDWWAYKQEAYDAIPQNAALMDEAGAVTTINSDSGELIRHLYHEAGKSVRYADMDPVRALALATKNGAIQLGLGDRTGTIEAGKDADLTLLDGEPMSVYARVEWTMVDGLIEFERRDAFELDERRGPVRTIDDRPSTKASYRASGGPVTAIVGGTLHTVTGEDVEGGTLLIQDGRIVALGASVRVPDGAVVVDATGKHVWPGMIGLATPIGITEIGSVPATQDQREIGGNQPDLRVTSSVNAASAHIGVARTNGITRSQTAPQGGGPMRGQSALLRLAGDTWEEMLTIDRDMLHIGYPRARRGSDDKKDEEPESVTRMRDMLEDAREYARIVSEAQADGTQVPPFDARLEALAPYANGEKRVALHVSGAASILKAIRFAQEEELDVVLYGCLDGWKVADAIAQSGFPVVVGPVLTVPRSEYDPYDAGYANPGVLHRAGVRFAIMTADGSNERNLPFHAGFAAAYGLPREEALRAVTYYPAEILGVEGELGSLAVGKLADVVVTDGDLLETTTQVTHLWIDGVAQDVKNRQTRLYDYYHDRLHRLQGR